MAKGLFNLFLSLNIASFIGMDFIVEHFTNIECSIEGTVYCYEMYGEIYIYL